MSVQSAFHTFDTFATGATVGVVFGFAVLPRVWAAVKAKVVAWVAAETAKVASAFPTPPGN